MGMKVITMYGQRDDNMSSSDSSMVQAHVHCSSEMARSMGSGDLVA